MGDEGDPFGAFDDSALADDVVPSGDFHPVEDKKMSDLLTAVRQVMRVADASQCRVRDMVGSQVHTLRQLFDQADKDYGGSLDQVLVAK